MTCVQYTSACVDRCVWVGLEMTSIIYCVGSQLDSCSIINWTIEVLTPRCPLGDVPVFKQLAVGITEWTEVWCKNETYICETNANTLSNQIGDVYICAVVLSCHMFYLRMVSLINTSLDSDYGITSSNPQQIQCCVTVRLLSRCTNSCGTDAAPSDSTTF